MWFSTKEKEPKYSGIPKDEEGGPSPELQFLRVGGTSSLSSQLFQLLPWVASIIFALSTLFLWIERSRQDPFGSFGTGWTTDFSTARREIEAQQVIFHGSTAIHDNGTLFIPNPDPVKYYGEPREEVDANWERLTWGRYILITEQEARETWGDDIDDYWDEQRGGYVAGFDMFHTLHCVSQLRNALYSSSGDGHHHKEKREELTLHHDHCIEQIRQFIMCSGDMTPLPTKFYPGLGRNYVDSDRPHTCRNFEKLQHWMVDRYEGSIAVQPSSHPRN